MATATLGMGIVGTLYWSLQGGDSNPGNGDCMDMWSVYGVFQGGDSNAGNEDNGNI